MGAPFRGVSVHVGAHAVPMCCSAPADYKCACIDVSYSNKVITVLTLLETLPLLLLPGFIMFYIVISMHFLKNN